MTPLRRRLLTLLLPAALAACRGQGNIPFIAVAVPLTGDTGSEGQGLRRGVELAVDEFNAMKRLPTMVGVLSLDDRTDPREAVNVANLIISDRRVVAVIGPYSSSCALSAAPFYARAGLPMVVPSATRPEVTTQQLAPGWPGPRNVFRVCPTDDAEGAYAAEFMRRKLGLSRLAVVFTSTDYGRGLAGEVRRRFAALGGRVEAAEQIDPGQKDFGPLVRKLRALAPEGVYFAGVYTEGGLLLKALRAAGFRAPFVSGDGLKTAGLFSVAGEAAEGAYVTMVGAPAESLPGASAFLAKYRERYGLRGEVLRPYDLFAYEAAWVVLEALARSGPDRGRLLEQIRATDRQGPLGRTRFDEKGDTLNKVISVSRAKWKDKAFVSAD